ncbi:cell division protein FtsQ [Arthrobacter stackebrandtii]|uniref:Cell division protein FtsQ n=1 Tax=Arthrobacter stackebrandtii TaxID=272161 RepID=A0ABS4Z1N8_9MICC|nr:cell division protein FtsQ/DivIB [Arthrobacter stackebrandtii]MBP2414976.1 cell division protein FtsQ [Arthrobacter stackebrandtii]PYH00957.1 peptidase S33 [Arthrobacter stackebrandtii]
MAEPRKPRVIRTRPGHDGPGISADPQAQEAPAHEASAGDGQARNLPAGPSSDGARVQAAPAAGAVRSTSSKVSVEPLPDGGKARGVQPVRGKVKAKARAVPGPVTGSGAQAPSRKAGPAAATPAEPASATAGVGKTATPRPGAAKPAGSGASRPGPAAGTAREEHAPGDAGTDAQVLAFPMPAHKRRRRAVIYGTAGVLAVLALVMSFALFSPVLAVKTVVFDGQKLVDPKILDHAIAPVYGRPLPQVTAEDVQKLLEPVVQVKSSSIEAKPPSTLLVHIVERVPVALLKNEDSYLLVDPDGVELGSTADPASVPLPLIDGGKAVIGQDTFKAMTAVLANLPQTILSQLANATAASPDAVELKLVDGRSVIWGDASDMELKAVVLEALLTAPAPEPVPGEPEPAPVNVFDVSAPRHPVTR